VTIPHSFRFHLHNVEVVSTFEIKRKRNENEKKVNLFQTINPPGNKMKLRETENETKMKSK